MVAQSVSFAFVGCSVFELLHDLAEVYPKCTEDRCYIHYGIANVQFLSIGDDMNWDDRWWHVYTQAFAWSCRSLSKMHRRLMLYPVWHRKCSVSEHWRWYELRSQMMTCAYSEHVRWDMLTWLPNLISFFCFCWVLRLRVFARSCRSLSKMHRR